MDSFNTSKALIYSAREELRSSTIVVGDYSVKPFGFIDFGIRTHFPVGKDLNRLDRTYTVILHLVGQENLETLQLKLRKLGLHWILIKLSLSNTRTLETKTSRTHQDIPPRHKLE